MKTVSNATVLQEKQDNSFVIDDFSDLSPADIKPLSAPARNHIVYKALRGTGLTIPQAAKVAGLKRNQGYVLEKKAAKSILAPYAAKAKKAVKSILEGEPVGSSANPKCSDVLAAASLVMDRIEPRQNVNINKNLSVNVDITGDERERIKQSLGIA